MRVDLCLLVLSLLSLGIAIANAVRTEREIQSWRKRQANAVRPRIAAKGESGTRESSVDRNKPLFRSIRPSSHPRVERTPAKRPLMTHGESRHE